MIIQTMKNKLNSDIKDVMDVISIIEIYSHFANFGAGMSEHIGEAIHLIYLDK